MANVVAFASKYDPGDWLRFGVVEIRLIRESYEACVDVHLPISSHNSSGVDGLLSLHGTMKRKKAIYLAGLMRKYWPMDIPECVVRFSNQS